MGTIQYNTIQYNTIQYNTIQYNTIQYSTIQYNTEDDLSIKCKFLYYLNKMTMTIHLDCYATTDCKPEIEFHMMNEIYAALRICTHIQKRRHFYAKTTIANIYMKGLPQC